MKKILSFLLCLFLITGCSKEKEDNKLKENNQKEPEVTNKVLECTNGDSGDDYERKYTYVFTYDESGEKLKTINFTDSISYFGTKLSDYNIGENKKWCNEANTYGGLNCEYEINNDKTLSTIKYVFDFNNLDDDAKDVLASEVEDGLENYTFETLKPMLEKNYLTCK